MSAAKAQAKKKERKRNQHFIRNVNIIWFPFNDDSHCFHKNKTKTHQYFHFPWIGVQMNSDISSHSASVLFSLPLQCGESSCYFFFYILTHWIDVMNVHISHET